ncbi:MAG: histidine ammonia-lyase [Clostridia bacterium]|nr:histidine ammonia-lyase [Clostridia bacterium]
MVDKVIIDSGSLTLDDFIAVCRNGAEVKISKEAIERINNSRRTVNEFVENGDIVYGITTGFGRFSEVCVTREQSRLIQKNLIVSHAVGSGDYFVTDIVRGIILLRINNLCIGYSGVRYSTIKTMVDMLNKGVHPLIPEKGSLGASGDLAPLAHMVLPMLGLGKAEYRGEIFKGAEAMKKAGITTIELVAKEGLALINGTQVMTSVGAHTVYDAIKLLDVADLSASLTFEALHGIVSVLDPRLHKLRPHKGQIDTATNIMRMLEGSTCTLRQSKDKVQDAYSLRCTPQVHGASRDAIEFVREKVEIEMNSVTDNPIIFHDTKEGISGGNFHGQPVALAFDFLGIALSELADISERRLERMVNPALNGLPAFLVDNGGLNSGFMIVQYSAAALVSENKVLSHPASVDSIPSSGNQEDHVSMGTISARKAREIYMNVRRVIAMEMLCACQAIDLGSGHKLGYATQKAYNLIRGKVKKLIHDREMFDDINDLESLIINEKFDEIINKIAGDGENEK